jgi:hypothetical protein
MKNNFKLIPLKTWVIVLCMGLAMTLLVELLYEYYPDQALNAEIGAFLFGLAIASGLVFIKSMLIITNARWASSVEPILNKMFVFVGPAFIFLCQLVMRSPMKTFNAETDNILYSLIGNGSFRAIFYCFGTILSSFAMALISDREKKYLQGLLLEGAEKVELPANRFGKALSVWSTVVLCLVLLGLSFEYFVFPKWHAPNPMAAVNLIVTGFLSALALFYMFIYRSGGLPNNKMKDIFGRLIFGFSIFWAYINFSELLITKYSLSNEGAYGIIAGYANDGRVALTYLLCFAIPFVLLLPRKWKSNDLLIRFASVAIIHGAYINILRYLDLSLSIATALSVSTLFCWWIFFWSLNYVKKDNIE